MEGDIKENRCRIFFGTPCIYILKSCLKFELTDAFGLRIDYDWDPNGRLLFLRAAQDGHF